MLSPFIFRGWFLCAIEMLLCTGVFNWGLDRVIRLVNGGFGLGAFLMGRNGALLAMLIFVRDESMHQVHVKNRLCFETFASKS